jgi:hypothetical protein
MKTRAEVIRLEAVRMRERAGMLRMREPGDI